MSKQKEGEEPKNTETTKISDFDDTISIDLDEVVPDPPKQDRNPEEDKNPKDPEKEPAPKKDDDSNEDPFSGLEIDLDKDTDGNGDGDQPSAGGNDDDKEDPEKDGADDDNVRKNANRVLRDRADELAKSLKEAEDQMAEREERISNMEQQLRETETKLNETNEQLAYRDPREHPEVKAIIAPWNDKLADLAETMDYDEGPDGDPLGDTLKADVGNLIARMEDFSVVDDKKKLTELKREFKDDVMAKYGQEHGAGVIRLIQDGVRSKMQATKKAQEIVNDRAGADYRESSLMHSKLLSDLDKRHDKAFSLTPEQIEQDPFSTPAIVQVWSEKDDKVKKAVDDARKWAKRVLLPPAPIDPAEMAKKDPDTQAKIFSKREAEATAARESLEEILPHALIAYRLLPGMQKLLAEHKEALSEAGEEIPKPGKQGEEKPKKEGDGRVKISDFDDDIEIDLDSDKFDI